MEKQLQEKKTALAEGSPSTENLPSDKELLHESIGEQIQQHAPQYMPNPPAGLTPPPQVQNSSSYLTQEFKDKIQELINIVFTKNIDEGIKAATKSNNPALIDAFHDALVDELYSALVERGKLKPTK